ncbi:hypothetical protein [Winogradskyella sp. J14-2]|uniref:hypothetical protein n=1 Tax=Winogradskyella sp. J14-2 TaxID=1936080 RepID=UPI0012F92C9E|nr:hypothetical protein [Winogradskyella sp. J14-2]
MMKNFILFLTLLVLLSCNSDDPNPQNCTEVYVFGLNITFKDANTQAIITDGITVTAKDGSYQEQLTRIEDSDYFLGAGEREGTYIIEVTSNNYQTFISNPILVDKTEDNCHVITRILEFQLTPN